MGYQIETNKPPSAEQMKRTRGRPDGESWPFKDMKIDERMKVTNSKLWNKAVCAAHVTGRQKGMKFKTQWAKSGNFGYIWRIACLLLMLIPGVAQADDYERGYEQGQSADNLSTDAPYGSTYRRGFEDGQADDMQAYDNNAPKKDESCFTSGGQTLHYLGEPEKCEGRK